MIILIPILLVIFTLYIIDAIYFDDVKPKNIKHTTEISKESNTSAQKYLDRYLKK